MWYDVWSALLAASIQLHCRESTSEAANLAVELTHNFIHQAFSSEGSQPTGRFAAIRETLFALSPFPHCTVNGCNCFGSRLHHEYQEVSPLKSIEGTNKSRVHVDSYELHFPGVWLPAFPNPTETLERVLNDARKRRNRVRDPDDLIHQVTEDLRRGTRNWIRATEPSTPDTGYMKIYIVDCPLLHPLDSQALKVLLERQNQESAVEVQPRFLDQLSLQNIDHLISSNSLRKLTIGRR